MAENAGDRPGQGQGRRRKGWVAVLLSLLLTGLGQLYNGQQRKAIVYFVISNIAPLVLILLAGHALSLVVIGTLLALQGGIQLVAAIDAWRTARRLGSDFQPAWFNRFSVYLVTYLVFGLLLGGAFSWYVRAHVFEAFSIASGSMEPTLLLGDQILIDKSSTDFARGDLVVFEFLLDAGKAEPREYVKRIVGLPGDVIEIRDKQLLVNGRPIEEPYAVHNDTETIPPQAQPRDFFGPVTVPEGGYFMLGDNRDRSFDSRFWGVVEKGKVWGRVVSIYWSWDWGMFEVRWGRIGNVGSGK